MSFDRLVSGQRYEIGDQIIGCCSVCSVSKVIANARENSMQNQNKDSFNFDSFLKLFKSDTNGLFILVAFSTMILAMVAIVFIVVM